MTSAAQSLYENPPKPVNHSALKISDLTILLIRINYPTTMENAVLASLPLLRLKT